MWGGSDPRASCLGLDWQETHFPGDGGGKATYKTPPFRSNSCPAGAPGCLGPCSLCVLCKTC